MDIILGFIMVVLVSFVFLISLAPSKSVQHMKERAQRTREQTQ